MQVYHGSPRSFDLFDYKHIGTNGTTEGYGFYFTDNPRIAETYSYPDGYLYTAQLSGRPLSGSTRTITEKEYIQLAIHLHHLNGYLDNYGDTHYYGINTVLENAVRIEWESAADDASLIGSIITACGENSELILRAVYSLFGYGYIIDKNPTWGCDKRKQTIYIAIDNQAIQIVDKQPAKKPDN